MRADMKHVRVLPSEKPARKVLLALNASPESKAGLVWAVGNLVRKGDEVLLFHMVKTPMLIPTAMGMVPYVGATPAMQRAHILVASCDGTKLLRSSQAYCKSKMIHANAEVGRCNHREEDLLRKASEEGATHLVLGTGGASRFSFRLAKKPSLTARVCQRAPCHVILVDKKKRPTFHPANPPTAEPTRALSPGDSESPRSWDEALWQWRPVIDSPEPRAKMRGPPGGVSPWGCLSPGLPGRSSPGRPRRRSCSASWPLHRTPFLKGDAKDPALDDPPEEPATNALQSPAPTEPPRRYFASLPEKLQERSDVDVTLRAKMDAVRTWSQNLEPFSVPDSDTDGYADSDADADRNADSPGATYSSVSAVATPPAVALVSGDARPDVSGDACSVLRNVLPKRQATVNFVDGRSPSRTVESVRALPVRKICDLHSENAAGNQLPGTKSGSVNDGVCTNPALRSVQTPPSSKQRPVPSVNALISRVYLALNESESSAASSSGSEPPAEFCDSPTEVGVQSPRHGGIPQKPAEPTDGVVTAGNPVSQARTPARTLVKPPTVLTPSFGPSPDGSPKAGGRPPAVPRSLDRKLSDGPWNGTGQPPEGRRTSAEPSPFRRCGSDERTPGGQGTLTGGRRTPGRTRTLSEASSAERHEAAVRLLREQLALLTEGDELRDDVAERAAARWERARRRSEEMAARQSPDRREQ